MWGVGCRRSIKPVLLYFTCLNQETSSGSADWLFGSIAGRSICSVKFHKGSYKRTGKLNANNSRYETNSRLLSNNLNSNLFFLSLQNVCGMYWTLELAYHLEDAPWPATRDELIDYAIRSGAPLEVIENLQQMEDEGEAYEGIEEIWPDYPRKDDFLFNEDEY
jgi:hypothetical protein